MSPWPAQGSLEAGLAQSLRARSGLMDAVHRGCLATLQNDSLTERLFK